LIICKTEWGRLPQVFTASDKARTPVSMPIEWEELTNDLAMGDFTMHNALFRLQKKGDLFKSILGRETNLVNVISRFEMK